MVAAVAFLPLFAAFNWPPTHLWPLCAFAAVMVLLIVVRHRTNIARLLKGQEDKIGRKVEQHPDGP
jgi:glycerol-3-phosphate acyltransferase PlsY